MQTFTHLVVVALGIASVWAEQEWKVTAGTHVSLDVLGFNLNSRRIKVIEANSSCEEDGTSWAESVLVDCTTSCRQAAVNATVALHSLGHDTADCFHGSFQCKNVSIISLRVITAVWVEVEFDGIADLHVGDRILLGSEVVCEANCEEAQLDILRGNTSTGHEVVSRVSTRRFNLRVPALMSEGPVPAFQVSSASWVCTNRVRTARELYSTSPQAGLRVCLTTGEGSFVQAGSLTIQALPDQMPVAWLSPTSTALGTASPLAVTFKFPTLPEESSNESMRLQLHFNLSQLEPLQVDGTLLSSPLFDEQPSAALCGRLFRELWANGSGFPHPRYCSSRAMGDNVSLIMQLLFDGGLLQSNHIYQIVVLALAKTSLDSALKLWLMGSSNPHLLYSVGVPELTQTFQDAAGPTDPHLSSVKVLGGSNGVLQLESGRNLELLIAGENARPIHGGAQLRIFLSPLTAWVAHGENSHGCSSLHVMKDLNSTQLESPCQVLSVVPSMAFNNLLKLTLPLEIGQVSEESRLAVEIGLGLPSGSFFAEQLVVEIRLPDSSKPHSAISSMNLLSWLPNSSAAVLISRQQTDSLAPFSATSNQLYLRLTLAATLRSLLEDSDPTGAAGFSLIAPLGYSLQAAVETSGVLESSRWSCTGRACKCTLPPFAAIWAGSAVFITLQVVNPDWPLRRCSLRNVWQISLQAGGFHTTNLQVPASEASFRMQDGSACNFSEGVSVLGRISPALVQPTRLSVSPANGEFVTNTLQVFFTAEQGVEFPARLRIEAHEDFVFQDGSCADLPEMFYAADGKGSRTWALPVQRCETHGRYAMVSFVGSLLPQQEYGFQIEVWNPQHYDPSHQASWVLTTLTEAGEEVDQTSGILEPLGLYSHQMRVVKADEDDGVGSALGLQVINGFPFAASGHEAQVIISPLRTAVDLSAALRITAPSGYQWAFVEEDMERTPGSNERLPGGVPSASSHVLVWPHARYEAEKTYEFQSGMRLPEAADVMGTAFFVEFGYDQTSLAEGHRMLAGRVDAPAIRWLKNTKVEHSSSLRNSRTKLTLQVEVVTPLPPGGALVVRTPSGFAFMAPCSPQVVQDNALPMAQPLPSTVTFSTRPFPEVLSKAEGGSQQVDLVLTAGLGGIPDGVYRFEVTAINGEAATVEQDSSKTDLRSTCTKSLQCWTFLSLVDSRGESFGELDARSFVLGYQLKQQMPKAILLQAAGRTDRPLQSNRLTFGFQLLNSLTGEALEWGLLLRGPTGALLKEDCFVNPENLDPKLHSFWEGAPVGSCKATGAVAALSLTSALKAEIRYAFALQVQQNPPSTPALNLWYLEAAAEGSSPIDGFEVQRINMEVTPLTEASGSVWPKLDANLVNLSFSLQTNQAQAGLLITVPSNFVFEHSDLCPLLLEVDALADLCASGNCRCHVQASNVMAISLVGQSLTKDRNYVLTLLGVGSEDGGSERKWRMESFADPNFQEGLDAGEVVGFRFCSPVNRLSIGMRNPTNQDLAEPSQDGSAFLGDLQLALELPHAVIAGDMIQVELPSSYELHEMDASCSQLHWWEGNTMSLLPSFIAANCSPQRVVLNFLGNSEVHVLVNQALTLQFSTNNPHRIYGRVFWHVRHFRGNQLVAAGAFQNWKVFPLLLQTAVELASMAPSKREGQSAMDVGFVAVESATHVRIKGSHGFDFSLATSRSGLVVRTEDANVLLLNRVMQDSEKINLHVLDISLPDSGPAFIDLETLNGDGEVVARKVGLPIPIPGQLTISKSILKNEYQATPSQYPLQSSWPARVGEHILVELEVEFPTPLAQGNMLRLSGHPFQMQGSLDIHSAGALVPTLVHSFTDEEVMVSLAGEGLPSSFPSKIRATVIAPNTSPERSARWSLEVVSESFRPISMGVLEEADIHLVNRCEVEVTSQRSPPLATIEVNVRMRFPDLVPHHVALVAPLGFTFLPDCLKGSVGASATCKPAPLAAVNDQASAEVTGVQGLKNLTLSVNTPSITPTSRSWFLLALNQEGNIVAWCEDKLGIRVIQMRSVAMIYPALPEVSSELAVRFLLSDPLPAGGTIQLLSPPEIELNCSGELQQMSLPIQGCTRDEGSLELTLAFGLPAGLHSFALGLRTPSTNPKQNNFSLFIRSPAGSMHEAVTSVQGRKLKEKVWLSSRPLKHTAAEAGQASSIVIGFEVHEKLGKATLGAVLITMAEDFKHTLRFDGDIEILNKALPIAYSRRDGWAEVQQVDRILIFLDPAQEIPEGAYDFRFPVTVPEELSAFNVWQITLCQPGFAEACSDSESPDALLTFPTTGFGLKMPNRSTTWSVGFAKRSVLGLLSLATMGYQICT